MRWTCPHCNAAVSAPDDKVGSDWIFSRCYRCNGATLVRKAEVNLMKVDRAPKGERVLMTEPVSRETPPLLGFEVTGKIEDYVRAGKNPNVFHASAPEKKKKKPPESVPAPNRSLIARSAPFLAGIAVFAMAGGMFYAISTRAPAPKASSPATDALELDAAAPARVFATVPKVWITIRNGGANVFGGPGLSFPITGTLEAGRKYEIVDRNDQWVKVRVAEKPDRVGWVRSDLAQ